MSRWVSSIRERRAGASSLEAMMGLTLLSAALTFATPLIVRHGRLITAQRNYRLALDEVSNQLERISLLPESELDGAMRQLAVSEFVREKLTEAEVRGEVAKVDFGRRVTVRLSWREGPERPMSVALAAWAGEALVERPAGGSEGAR